MIELDEIDAEVMTELLDFYGAAVEEYPEAKLCALHMKLSGREIIVTAEEHQLSARILYQGGFVTTMTAANAELLVRKMVQNFKENKY